MSSVAQEYLNAVRRLRRTGQATDELSYYPAIQQLLDGLSVNATPSRRAMTHPTAIEMQHPDLALYETASLALVLPVEVKGSQANIETLLHSGQALRYATTFGGGKVLLTNLWQWCLAEVGPTGDLITEAPIVNLVADSTELDRPNALLPEAEGALRGLLEMGSLVRGAARDPKAVASLLAFHARNMRDAITATSHPMELLEPTRKAFHDGLGIELNKDTLVPTVVQTLVYGTFAAWLRAGTASTFRWMHSSFTLSVPVFAEVLHGAMSPRLLRQCDLTRHLDAIERVLTWTDRETFANAFDGDAIQYFYEPFLAQFDEELRNALGIWYTPAEIAAYQVARADYHVRADLGKPLGLADESVYLLDPAVGTGTYLIAAVDHLFAFHTKNGEPPQVAADRALQAALTRFVGFEILPAAFIICHLHLSRHLQHLGAVLPRDRRLRVYLTNSLTGWNDDDAPEGLTLFPELETELKDAASAKHTDPVLVVLGNPPWQGYSSAETAEEKALVQPWVESLGRDWGLRKHRLNDLYVRFWRIAVKRIAEITGVGVVSYITNRKWLGGRSYPAMRHSLTQSFADIWVDDLHGDVHDRSHPGDQSIFTTKIADGIQVGTAIVTAVRTSAPVKSATLHRCSYRGSAIAKRNALSKRAQAADMSSGYSPFTPTRATRYRFTDDSGGDFPALDEYLTFFLSGVQPVGEAVISRDTTELEQRMRDYFDPAQDWSDLIAKHPLFAVTRARYDGPTVRKKLLRTSKYESTRITRYLFRPFDTRALYWEPDEKLLNEARRELIPYWLHPSTTPQVSIVAPQTRRRVGASRLYATHAVGGFNAIDPDARVFPLYGPTSMNTGGAGQSVIDASLSATGSSPTTVSIEWIRAAKSILSCRDTEAAEAVFYALIAVSHSGDWIETQAIESDSFPTIPIPGDAAHLRAAADIGKALVALLDPDTPVDGVTTGQIRPHLRDLGLPDPVTGDQRITSGRKGASAGRRRGIDVYWDSSHAWRNIPDHVWGYAIGGFQVLPKWLSYRMDPITQKDRDDFRLLCRRIQAISDLSDDCNAAFAAAVTNPLSC